MTHTYGGPQGAPSGPGSNDCHLKGQASVGLKWSALSQAVREALQFVIVAVMARLLAPADFGLLTMAGVVTGFVSMFKNLGISAAIVQRRDLSEDLLSSVFWVNIVFSTAITGVLWWLAPSVAALYSEPRISDVLRLLSLTIIISELGAVQAAVLEREVRFQALAVIEIAAVTAGAFVGIGAAFLDYQVWSLVLQALTISAVTTALLWMMGRWRPHLEFHWSQVRSISSYSLNLTGFNIFNYVARNADYFLIGRYLGSRDLGFYAVAYQLMLRPVTSISSLVGRVTFPLFSRIQDDNARFGEAYLDLCRAIALATFPMMLGLWVVADPFIPVVFGAKWSPVVPLLLFLAPVGAVQSIGTTVGIIYQAKGSTGLMFLWGVFSGTVVTVAFLIGLQWGVIGVAAAYAIVGVALIPPNFMLPMRLIGLRFIRLIRALARPAAAAVTMAALVLMLQLVVPEAWPGWVRLSALVTAGIVAYGLFTFWINRRDLTEVLSLLRQPQRV